MAEGLLERTYQRLGPRYLERAVFVQQQLVYGVIVAAVALLSLYVDMSLGEFVRLVLLGCALQLAYSLLTIPVVRQLTQPVRVWLQAARSEDAAPAAWSAAASFPRELLVRGLISFPLGPVLWLFFLLWCFYFAWELDLPAYSALLVYVAVVLVVSYGAALRFFGAERIVRPVLEDLQRVIPGGVVPDVSGLSLRTRLLAALPAINVITAVVAYGVARGGAAELGELVAVMLIGAAVATTVSLVLTVLLSNSITRPIGALQAAAREVSAGHFEARVPVVTTDETGELSQAFNAMTVGLAERERIREAFGTYVDREVAEHILREGTNLAGEQVEVTIMFIDIRNFTGYAERSAATEVVATINRLFARTVPVIHDHGGHVDKFVGDGLLAVFGAPRRQRDHADQALAAALDVSRAASEELRGELEIGIGLNSGTVVAGNVGGGGRLEFSVIGDAVNVAARVEAATRRTGDRILLAERTKELLRDGTVELLERPDVELKGKSEAVSLYAPLLVSSGASE